ncbi:MAG: hypothetical protein WCF84_14195 [Anaerolineae bacterium]
MGYVQFALLLLILSGAVAIVAWIWRKQRREELLDPRRFSSMTQPGDAPAEPVATRNVASTPQPKLSVLGRSKPAPSHTLQVDHEEGRIIYWADGVPYASIADIPDPGVRDEFTEMVALKPWLLDHPQDLLAVIPGTPAETGPTPEQDIPLQGAVPSPSEGTTKGAQVSAPHPQEAEPEHPPMTANAPATGAGPGGPASQTTGQAQTIDLTNAIVKSLAGTQIKRRTRISEQHTLKLEREGERVIYWYDGIPYGQLEDIPDESFREQARILLSDNPALAAAPASTVATPAEPAPLPTAPATGDASAAAPAAPVTDETQPAPRIRIVINDTTYNSLDEISDPRLRQLAERMLRNTKS